MRSRREYVQAYRFLTRRIVSAQLVGEPETNELPMRRFAFAVFGGFVVALLVFAGFGVYGLIRPGGKGPVAGAIIVERETGSKYLYLDGLLHPVLNWTSARLILNEEKPQVRTMAQASLRDVPRGRPVGIAGAPDALPAKKELLGMPWSVCSAPRSRDSVALATQVIVGQVPANGVAPGAGEGLLVSVDDVRYLVLRNFRLRIRDNATVAALGWAGVRPTPVGGAFLNALPAGPDLQPLAVPDAGTQAQVQIGGAVATVGRLYRAAEQFYVAVRTGLVPVGAVAARLAGDAVDIPPAEAGQKLVSGTVEPPGFPTEVPDVRGAAGRFAMACAEVRGGENVTVRTYPGYDDALALAAGQAQPTGAGADGVPVADRVAVPGGRAALVRSLTGAVYYLVTDQGIKYPLPRDPAGALKALGYSGVRPGDLPAAVLALISTGPALDPAAAVLLAPPATVAPEIPSPTVSRSG
jgi:type VII secretion protein EccB